MCKKLENMDLQWAMKKEFLKTIERMDKEN